MSLHDEQGKPEGQAKGGRGGRRAGAGRKPNGSFAPVQGDLNYAKRLLSSLMRDESQPTPLRARCALAIVTRGTSKGDGPRADGAKPPVGVCADPRDDGRGVGPDGGVAAGDGVEVVVPATADHS